MKTTVWVLTRSYNDYNQYGEYFQAVYLSKPSKEKLKDQFPDASEYTWDKVSAALLLGGGREGTEDEWYNLEEVEVE